MIITVLLLGFVTLYLLVKFLQLAVPSEVPTLYYNRSEFNEDVLKSCPILKEPYVPTLLWGKNGHIQTTLYAKVGRFACPTPTGERQSIVMQDGATITYDVFQPHVPHDKGDFTLFVCPGIGNSSKNKYMLCFIDFAQSQGYRVVCMNHLGAIQTLKITASRIFNYGGTEELAAIVEETKCQYPQTKMIAVGYSLGANILLKYLGEDQANQKNFIAVFSGCQGYDAEAASQYCNSWDNFRRGYMYVISKKLQQIIKAHEDVLFSEEAQMKYGPFDVKKILTATTPKDIDNLYFSKRAGFSSTEEYYKWSSCKKYIQNVHIPVFFLNALDDPLVPDHLLETPRTFTASRQNAMFVTTRHGGHLGYFEGGFITPDTLTWIDKLTIQYCDAIAAKYHRDLRASGYARGTSRRSAQKI